jgi:hypothetical protein
VPFSALTVLSELRTDRRGVSTLPPSLKVLSMAIDQQSDLSCLSGLTELRFLFMAGLSWRTPVDLSRTALPSLTMLDLGCLQLDAAGLAHLTALRSMDLRSCVVSGLRALTPLTRMSCSVTSGSCGRPSASISRFRRCALDSCASSQNMQTLLDGRRKVFHFSWR